MAFWRSVSLWIFVVFVTVQARPNGISNDIDCGDDEEFAFDHVQEKWLEQPLNHFDVQDKRTFRMRYLEDISFFQPGGPLVLLLGGETNVSPLTIKQTQSIEMTKKLSGVLMMLEHRYYGKSTPFDNLTAANLVYLNVEQALEDIANFVYTIKKTRVELRDSKVAAFGCSYSGSLATWFRYKYPHLVDAVWASGAPLRAVSDFYEYLEVASEVYSNASWDCYNTIRDGYTKTKELLSTPEGKDQVKQALENWSCGNVTEMSDSVILAYIRFVLADHNVPPDHAITSCNILQNRSHSAFEALMLFLKVKSPDVCENDEEAPNDDLAWRYQTCTEFGFSVTTNSRRQPFNDSSSVIDDDIEECLQFGKEFTLELLQKGIERINRNYGGQNIKVTRVLSVHGAQDPWHKLGLYEQVNEDAPVLMIPGTSHCADQLCQLNEPIELTKAKKKGQKIMAKWLGH